MLNRILSKLDGNAYNQRWGIGAKMILTDPDGVVYLRRRRVIQTPVFAIYLHDILTPDADRSPHSHPFPFISVVLRGGYLEHVHFPGGTVMGKQYQFFRGAGRAHTFPRGTGQVHRIDAVLPRTKTLVLAGRRQDSWGFFVDGEGLIPWREYLEREGRDAVGRRVNNGDDE